MTEADLRSFELLAETLATERAARETVGREGMTVSTGADGVKSHPATKIMETARAQAARLLTDFGLTPRGRGSIDPAPPVRAADPADRFF